MKWTIQELAEKTGASVVGDPHHLIFGVDALESATSQDASFLANLRYKEAIASSQAGVICVDRTTPLLSGKNYLLSDSPSETFQQIATLFLRTNEGQSGFSGIHPTAIIHPTAVLGENVSIGPYVVIDQKAKIGNHTTLHAHVSIGPNVFVGEHCLFYPHVVVRERCIVGNRVILQPGAVIGSCGFGYLTNSKGKHIKLDQMGIVILEDDVEIGALTTIDRARFKATRISQGTKIDNLVQIGHNVTVGEDNIIVSQTGIAGSAKTGKRVVIGGQAGLVGHIEIADGTMIASRGGVSKSIKKSGRYAGGPVLPINEYNKQQVLLRNIEQFVKKIEALEKRLENLLKEVYTETT